MSDRPIIFSAPMVRALLDGSLAERDPERVRCPTHDYARAIELRCADREPEKLRDALGSSNFDQGTDGRAIANQAIDRLQLLAYPKLASTKNIASNCSASLDFHLSGPSSHRSSVCRIKPQSFAADFAPLWQPNFSEDFGANDGV